MGSEQESAAHFGMAREQFARAGGCSARRVHVTAQDMLAVPPSRKLHLWVGLTAWLVLALALASSVFASSPWLKAAAMPFTPAYHALISLDSYLYVVGGDIGSGPLDKVILAKPQGDGAIEAWSESPYELPQAVAEHAAVEVDRRVYLIGGTNGRMALRHVFSTEIQSDGQIGPWQSESTLVPEGLRGHAGVAVGRSIYVIGGRDGVGKARNEIYRSSVDAAGQLRNWDKVGILPQPLSHAAAASFGGQVYLVGGENEKGPVGTVYAGVISPTGSLIWKPQRSLPKPLSRGAAFVTGQTIFFVGGYDGNTPSPHTYAAHIKDDGTLGDWIGWQPLPRGLMGLGAAVLDGRAYVAGGFDGARFSDSLQFLPIDPSRPAVPGDSPQPNGEMNLLPLAIAALSLVALASLLVVAIALVLEGRPPKRRQDQS